MASRVAVAEQWQLAAMIFMDGQHFSFCPALLTRKLYTVNWMGVRWKQNSALLSLKTVLLKSLYLLILEICC